MPLPVKLVLFTIAFSLAVYLIICALEKRPVKFHRRQLKEMLLWFAAVGCIGIIGEIFLDTIYNFFVGQPLWHYNILPIHNGYTSLFGPVMWGVFGVYLYAQQPFFRRHWPKLRTWHKAAIMAGEALVLEILFITISIPMFGQQFFYYHPGDLFHFTSLVAVPFWFAGGLVIYNAMKHFAKEPRFFTKMCFAISFALLIM
jgi:hypothetical protein